MNAKSNSPDYSVQPSAELQPSSFQKPNEEFISLATHELKTPLTSIKVFTQLLERYLIKQADPTSLHYVMKMNQQVERLTNLVEELVDVSKIESGKLKFDVEAFDMNALVTETVSGIQALNPQFTITVEGVVTEPLTGDQYRLGQVITNILTNAIMYSGNSKQVLIKLEENRDSVRFSVQDFGVGISDSDLKQVFRKFFRASDKHNYSFPGLGLGLYISQQIINRHGGTLSVISTKDKGSTFTFVIPKRTYEETYSSG